MIQRAIGVSIGAIATFLLLIFLAGGDPTEEYIAPVVIGALVSFFWPIVIAFWLGRRARSRQEDRIESEVQRQLNDPNRRG